MELLLIRHGRPERIDHDPLGADPALTELGQQQAAAMADFLAEEDISSLFVSPQRRAIETARPLAVTTSVEPIVVEGIAEFDLGHTQYIPGEERVPMSDEELEELIRGATNPDFLSRVRESVDKIIADNAGKQVAAVCHGGVISVVLNDIFGLPMETYHPASYTSVTRIRASRDGRRTMASFNEAHWLRRWAAGSNS